MSQNTTSPTGSCICEITDELEPYDLIRVHISQSLSQMVLKTMSLKFSLHHSVKIFCLQRQTYPYNVKDISRFNNFLSFDKKYTK